MKKIVYNQPDGTLAVCTPVTPEALDAALATCPPGAIVVDDTELPPTRDFRHAWTLNGSKITIDMAKVPMNASSAAQAQIDQMKP